MNVVEHLKLIKEKPGVYEMISDGALADLLLQLLQKQSILSRPKIIVEKYEQPAIDTMSRAEQEDLIKTLIESIPLPEVTPAENGRDGKDGKDAEITEDVIQEIVDIVYDSLFPELPLPLSSEEVRNRLELLVDDERLDKSAIKGIEEIEEAIEELKRRPSSFGSVGVTVSKVRQLIAENSVSNGEDTPTYEKISQNLPSDNITYSYNVNNDIETMTYTSGIVKTFYYSGDDVTSIVLSGNTPSGINLTKTFVYNANGDVIDKIYS